MTDGQISTKGAARVARRIGGALAIAALAFLASPALATSITVTFSGVITGVSDSTDQGALSGSNLVAGTSTFTGSFTYDSAASASFQAPGIAVYPTGTLTMVVDGVHTFTAKSPSLTLRNDDPNFNDRIDVSAGNQANNTFPFVFNPNDNLFRFTLHDSSRTVFADESLPTSLALASFDPNRFDGIFVRTDLDRQNSKLWTLSGAITSLQVTVPEPSVSGLLLAALGLGGFAGVRRRG